MDRIERLGETLRADHVERAELDPVIGHFDDELERLRNKEYDALEVYTSARLARAALQDQYKVYLGSGHQAGEKM